MYATNTAQGLQVAQQRERWIRVLFWAGCLVLLALAMMDPAFATGTGGSAVAQARITAVATGWQNIVIGIGAAILIIAWSVIGYLIAFNGKTLKDLQAPAIGTTIAGLAPVFVGWMYS
jgi:hypothetical protein